MLPVALGQAERGCVTPRSKHLGTCALTMDVPRLDSFSGGGFAFHGLRYKVTAMLISDYMCVCDELGSGNHLPCLSVCLENARGLLELLSLWVESGLCYISLVSDCYGFKDVICAIR